MNWRHRQESVRTQKSKFDAVATILVARCQERSSIEIEKAQSGDGLGGWVGHSQDLPSGEVD